MPIHGRLDDGAATSWGEDCMSFRDLYTDVATGQTSLSKIGAAVGYASLAWAFCVDAAAGGLTDMKMLAYGAIMIGSATASKIVSMKYSIPEADK